MTYSKGLLKDKKKVLEYENSSDKMYVNFPGKSHLYRLVHYLVKNKSIALFSKAPRSFRKDFNYTGVLAYKNIQISILSNNDWTQIQFNLTQVSYPFVLEFILIFSEIEDVTISCLHCSVDIKMDFIKVLKNFRALRLRNADTFSKIKRSISCKKGEVKFEYQTEYHGSGKIICIYDKTKQVKESKEKLLETKSKKTIERYLTKQITRIEIKHENKDTVPIRFVDQLPFLHNRRIFNNCWLRIDDSRESLSKREILLLDILDKTIKDLNLSLAVGLKIIKKRFNDSEWKMLTRALNKSCRVHYDFESAFKNNWNKYLKRKLSKDEQKFLHSINEEYSREDKSEIAFVKPKHLMRSRSTFLPEGSIPVTMPSSKPATSETS